MAATVGVGDRVILALLLGSAATPLVASLDGAGVLMNPPNVGFVHKIAGTTASVGFDDGSNVDLPCDGAGTCAVLKLGASSAVTTYVGRVVQRINNNAGPQLRGLVLFVATLIEDPLTPSAAVDVVVVKSLGSSPFYWLARASDVQVV